jgi:hypothetical protein
MPLLADTAEAAAALLFRTNTLLSMPLLADTAGP